MHDSGMVGRVARKSNNDILKSTKPSISYIYSINVRYYLIPGNVDLKNDVLGR